MWVGEQVSVGHQHQPLLSTPNRFGRTSQGSYWNSGNGSPDAVCFSVDRAGVNIVGVGVYGGGGTYECDVELLHDVRLPLFYGQLERSVKGRGRVI